MALTDVDLRQFLLRITQAMLWVVLACSLALNGFLLVADNTGTSPFSTGDDTQDASLTIERWGYGVVEREFAVSEQIVLKGIQIPPVRAYTVDASSLPHLTDELPLYRDQGVTMSDEEMNHLWSSLGIAFPYEQYSLRPSVMVWDSGDGKYRFTLDAVHRALRITNFSDEEPLTPTEKIGDTTFIDIASDQLRSFHIDPAVYGEPKVVRSTDDTGVYVFFPKLWNLLPLLTDRGTVVNGAEVRLDEETGKFLDVRLDLYDPATLTVSDYPTASAEDLVLALQSGGLLPLPSTPTNRAVTVSYTSIDPVYLLRTGDASNPTYVVPGVQANWIMDQTCKNCTPVLYSTVVPALSQSQFVWRE